MRGSYCLVYKDIVYGLLALMVWEKRFFVGSILLLLIGRRFVC